MYFNSALAGVPRGQFPEKKSTYPTAVIRSDMQPGGIFSKTKVLNPVVSSEKNAVSYTEGELGKTDITRIE